MEEARKGQSQSFGSYGPPDLDEEPLVNCKHCGRHFAQSRVGTHELICQKQKKRKPFDVCQQRVKGTDAEKFYRKNKFRNKPEKANSPPPQKLWRKQHEELISSMKAAREVTAILKKGGNLRNLPPPPPSDYSDYIQCPTCQRRFNSSAAERHIPKCAEMQHNKPKPPPPRKEVRSVRNRK